jgi:DNA-binding GntR family transcriptional regulator
MAESRRCAIVRSTPYEAIKHRILQGAYAIDDHLVEADLAASFEVSRTPIREALHRLSSEGLVTFEPNRGARVAGWSDVELAEIFELRALLNELGKLARKMEDLVAANLDEKGFHLIALANNEFHLGVLRAAGNERLVAILSSLVHVPLVQRTFAHYSPGALQRSLGHHRECLEALEANDGLWAESVMRAHILAARRVPASTPDDETP